VLSAAGSLSGGINKKGVAFYNNLINEIIAKGTLLLSWPITLYISCIPIHAANVHRSIGSDKIRSIILTKVSVSFPSPGMKPFVTIFHWDTPLALEEEYEGFLSENIVYVQFY
jgi:beta-glucosidase